MRPSDSICCANSSFGAGLGTATVGIWKPAECTTILLRLLLVLVFPYLLNALTAREHNVLSHWHLSLPKRWGCLHTAMSGENLPSCGSTFSQTCRPCMVPSACPEAGAGL